MTNIAIKVENLSKCYQIYDNPRDRLKQFVAPRLQRLTWQTPKQYFREFWALKDVSFEVKKGETVGIIGRNGSGKSTLLQMICGTLNPTSGSIQTSGRSAALLELGSGFNPEFTGRENVYMNAAVLGLTQDEIDKRYDDIVAFADIGEFINQPVKTYSSGMVVRLAFAVQSQIDPDILIVDEALSVGDAKFQAKC
ncbi:MAG: ABC transporter ATP-binding protein, partial [Methylophilaceae bacterium]|nr:ABC transporter ATP-binding protein [Methylophilaceae bacterium]